ncbi:MAG: ComF family protein [Thermodesulfobacteriota bacterium]
MSLFRRFLDLLYPPRCIICGAFLSEEVSAGESPLACTGCVAGFTRVGSPQCPVCGAPFRSGIAEDHVCEECLRKRPFFERAGAPFVYEGELMRAIHEFKYEGRSRMAGLLGPLMACFAEGWLGHGDRLVVMPVPLHPKRLRKRGFNQSLLLARHVADRLGGQVDFLSLRRTRDTTPQTGLTGDDRRRNVRRAFEVKDRKAVRRKRVVLVDDVATTGSTLNECARVLRRAGCAEVYGLVLARAAAP